MDDYLNKVKDYTAGELGGVSDTARLEAEEALKDSTDALKDDLKGKTHQPPDAEGRTAQAE